MHNTPTNKTIRGFIKVVLKMKLNSQNNFLIILIANIKLNLTILLIKIKFKKMF